MKIEIDLDCVIALTATAAMVTARVLGAELNIAIITAPLACAAAIRGCIGVVGAVLWWRHQRRLY